MKKAFFFTKNPNLAVAKRKPPKFPINSKGFSQKWTEPEWFVNAQKFYLMYLAGMDKNKYVKDSDYESLKKAYEKWDQRYYVVFYGDSAKWTCNLFVGEALYMAGKNSLTSSSKYYSAKQIWNEEGIFKQIKKSEVQRGDIVSFTVDCM